MFLSSFINGARFIRKLVTVTLIPLLVASALNTGLGVQSDAVATVQVSALPQIETLIDPQPAPSWDQVIQPQLARAEEQRKAKAAQDEADRLANLRAIAAENQRQLDARNARALSYGNYGNNYSPGQCTYYVASRISVPSSMGNATNWSWGLRNAGWSQGLRVGAIGVSHLGWAGHVVIVEGIYGNQVTVSEMNWIGPYVADTRTTSASDFEYYYH